MPMVLIKRRTLFVDALLFLELEGRAIHLPNRGTSGHGLLRFPCHAMTASFSLPHLCLISRIPVVEGHLAQEENRAALGLL